jgi:site-specific DNA-methyltransferase (adenine-specific)
MSLYYEDEYVTLHHGDCREESAWTAADVLVTDPPYGIAWQQPAYKTKGASEGTRTTAHEGIQNDEDTTARDAVLAMWGDRPGLVFGDIKLPFPTGTRRVLVWKKPNDAGLFGQSTWRKDWEPIFTVGNWPVSPAIHSSVIGSGAGSTRQYAQGVHPHAKPLAVMEHLISQCPPGVIADPFAGSGSTLVAARNLGRKIIGVELEERYCELIVKRLSQQAFDFSSLEAS